jgi:hypothetical protein
MIAGLPWSAWVLLLFAVGPGLILTSYFYFKRRNVRSDR